MLGPGRLFSAKSLRGASIANKNSGVSVDKSGEEQPGSEQQTAMLLSLDLMVGGRRNQYRRSSGQPVDDFLPWNCAAQLPSA